MSIRLVHIRDNVTGDTLARYDATSTSVALARYVRDHGLDPNATEETVLAASGLLDCQCGADHSTQTVGFTSRNPITLAADVDIFAETA